MIWLRRRSTFSLLRLADALGALAALSAGIEIETNWSLFSLRTGLAEWVLVPLFLGLNYALCSYFGLYAGRTLFFPINCVKAVVKAATAATMLLLLGASVFDLTMVTPLFLAVYWACAAFLGVAGRWLVTGSLFGPKGGDARIRRTLLVGTGPEALKLAASYAGHESGRLVVGFVDQTWRERPPHDGFPYVLATDEGGLTAYLREQVVDEVVVCLPPEELRLKVPAVVAACEEQGVDVSISLHLFELANPRMRPRQYGERLTVMAYSNGLDDRELILKRLMDVAGSLFLIALLSPVLLLTALAIRLTSGSPVLFSQERVGLHKRRFRFYKFRTMVVDAEARQGLLESRNETGGATFKMKNDPRVTPVGKFLRRTSIDELPQLFNVLMGDMSLVGPRPLPLRDVTRIEKDWPRRRFAVKPGITCIWQVSGRNAVPFDAMMAMDIDYVDNWSLWLDVKLLLNTIPVVLSCRGAY